MENTFTDTGFNDIMVGAELFNKLNLSQSAMMDPNNFTKVREIASFLNEHPDPHFVIQSVTNSNKNPAVKQIDHMLSYIRLYKERLAAKTKIEELDNQLKHYQ